MTDPAEIAAGRRIKQTFGDEAWADMMATNGDFRNARRLMREINHTRADILGLPRSTCPNVLRDKARAHLQGADNE